MFRFKRVKEVTVRPRMMVVHCATDLRQGDSVLICTDNPDLISKKGPYMGITHDEVLHQKCSRGVVEGGSRTRSSRGIEVVLLKDSTRIPYGELPVPPQIDGELVHYLVIENVYTTTS